MRKLLLVSALLASFPLLANNTHWEYSGQQGPANWAKLTPEFGQCAGSNQSPIDLNGLVEAQLPPLTFSYQKGSQQIINNGHTVQINYAKGSILKLDGMDFELKQFHFHAPSENLIKGRSFPLEGHFVHANKQGELAVVAVMYEVGQANSTLAQVWQQLPNKVGKLAALSHTISALELLPSNRDYYRFSGSLTTPPCSEGVRWLVLKQPVVVSQAQVDAFKGVMHHPNNRPVQALNGRVILQ